MSRIYFRKGDRQKLADILYRLPYCSDNEAHQITLKKVYHNIHRLLLVVYPSVLADLINSYITDYMSFKIDPHILSVYEDTKQMTFVMNIISMRININFVPYTIALHLTYNTQVGIETKYGLEHMGTREDYKAYVKHGEGQYQTLTLIPFFDYYLNNITKSPCELVDVKMSEQLYTSNDNNTKRFSYNDNTIKYIISNHKYRPTTYHMEIKNHKKLKNIIIMTYKLIHEMNKSFNKYTNKSNYNEFVKINKPLMYSIKNKGADIYEHPDVHYYSEGDSDDYYSESDADEN